MHCAGLRRLRRLRRRSRRRLRTLAPRPRRKRRKAASRTCWNGSCSTTSSAMATWLVHIALLAYAAGAAAFLTWLVRGGPRAVRIGRMLLLAGVLIHLG